MKMKTDGGAVIAQSAAEWSGKETLLHIGAVRFRLVQVIENLLERARVHDASKLVEPEASVFAEFTAKLRGCTYGSEEYKGYLGAMGPALNHHYAHNSHHPEHHEHGIRDMSLLDIVEMLADWKAATERHADGDLRKSIDFNAKRFGYDDTLRGIFHKTAAELGWTLPADATLAGSKGADDEG